MRLCLDCFWVHRVEFDPIGRSPQSLSLYPRNYFAKKSKLD